MNGAQSVVRFFPYCGYLSSGHGLICTCYFKRINPFYQILTSKSLQVQSMISDVFTLNINVSIITEASVGALWPVYTQRKWLIWSLSVNTAWYLICWDCNRFLEPLAWFNKESKQFNQSDIGSDITALALLLSVNCPLIRSRSHLIFDASSNASVNTDADTWCEWYSSNQCSPSKQQGTWER